MYDAEKNLIRHYDENIVYYSPAGDIALAHVEVYPKQDDKILDIGCGDGRLLLNLPSGISYLGVDYSENRIRKARVSYPSATFICQDIYEFLENDNGTYNLIACFEVLEHLVEPQRLIELAMKRLDKNGVFFGSVPVNMPYIAHLQVYKDIESVREAFQPEFCTEAGGHFWFKRYINTWSSKPKE
jgi:2-polyprenyl-3-methyl-5-hydroxy-6-metoxy-1,4-benzoquinol methylase